MHINQKNRPQQPRFKPRTGTERSALGALLIAALLISFSPRTIQAWYFACRER